MPKDGSFDVAGAAGWMVKRAMQMNPEIEPNLRSTVRGIVGSSLTPGEIGILEERALNAAELKDIGALTGIEPGVPATLTPYQKSRVDRLLGNLGDDELGRRARAAYDRGLRSGRIRIR